MQYHFTVFEDAFDYDTRDRDFESFLHPNVMETLKAYNLTPANLRKMYFKNKKITENDSEKFINMVGDTFFVHGVQKTVKIQVEHNSAPTYMYQFTYDKGHSFSNAMFKSGVSGEINRKQ